MTLQLRAANETPCSGSNFPGVVLRVEVWQEDNGTGVNMPGNYYNLYRKVMLVKRGSSGSGTSTWNGNNNCAASFSADVDNTAGLDAVWSAGGLGYDFRSSSGRNATNTVQMLGEGWFTVQGKADRTSKTIGVAAGWDSPGGDILGDTSTSTSFVLPGIAEAPGAPTIGTFDPVSSSSASLSWATPSSDGGAAITGYRIVYANNSGFTGAQTLDVGVSTGRLLTGLAPGQWWAKVAALNAATTQGAAPNFSGSVSVIVTPTIGDLDGWSSFGTLPAGLTPLVSGALRRGSIYPLGAGAPSGLLREIQCSGSGSVAAGAVGIERTMTGLIVGRTYKLNGTALSLQDTTPVGNIYRFAVVGIGNGSNATTSNTATPEAIPEYTFVATATSHVIRIVLNEAASWASSGWFEAVGFYGVTLTEIPFATPFRLQDVALETSLKRHYEIACDTIGGVWWVDSDDVTQFRQVPNDTVVRATFSDVRADGEYEYIDLSASYDTRNVVNVLDVRNHGRDAVTGNANDSDYSLADEASVALWGVRAGSVEMSLRAGYVDATNLIRNPRFGAAGATMTDWSIALAGGGSGTFTSAAAAAGGPSGCETYRRVTFTSSHVAPLVVQNLGVAGANGAVVPGAEYVFSVWVRSSVAATVYIDVVLYTSGSVQTLDSVQTPVALTANTWTRLTHTFTAPANSALAYSRLVTASNIANGATLDATGWRLSLASEPDSGSYFDGATASTDDHVYSWAGTPHASLSNRTTWEHLNDRIAEIVDKLNTPQRVVSQIVWNAQEDPELAALLDVQDRIRVRFRGVTTEHRIAGIKHKITGTRWLMTLALSPS